MSSLVDPTIKIRYCHGITRMTQNLATSQNQIRANHFRFNQIHFEQFPIYDKIRPGFTSCQGALLLQVQTHILSGYRVHSYFPQIIKSD